MRKVSVGLALRERLGESGLRDLDEYVSEHGEAWRVEMVNAIAERVDLRMHECAKRNEMSDGFSRVVSLMADMKVEILRWSFAFWVGQVAVIAALLAYMLK